MPRRQARRRLAEWARTRWPARRHRPVRQGVVDAVVATANIGRDAGADAVRAYLQRILDQLPAADLIILGLQEIDSGDPAEEYAILRDVADGYEIAGATTTEPIVWAGTYHRAGGTVTALTMKAIPGWSPNRRTVTQPLAADDTDALVAVINGHAPVPPDRWHGRYVPPEIGHALAHGWRAHHRGTKKALKLARRAEADVVVTQDTNRPNAPRWHRGQVLATPPSAIDRIAVIPGRGRTARVTDTGTIANGAGEPFHPARWAAITIRPTKETR